MIAQELTSLHSTEAERMLKRVGEAVLKRLRVTLPGHESDEEPLQSIVDTESVSYTLSTELHFQNTFGVRCAYEQLPSIEQAELFSGLQSAVRAELLRAEPSGKFAERDVDAYVFDDQSAVEVGVSHHRCNNSFFLPIVRAINWQRAELLVGDPQLPTEMNLYRLGYQETARTSDTTFYRHYDPTMPLVGHGYADGHHHISVFNTGKVPTVLTLDEPGLRVDLRQATIIQQQAVVQEPVVSYQKSGDVYTCRYSNTLLEQVTTQYGIMLTDDDARRLLNGQKTDVVSTSSGISGKLYVLNTPDGGPQLILQDVKPELTIRESYLGHVFTERDRQNLQKYGDMGRVVELTDRQSGQKFSGFIGVDKETRTLTVLRVDQIRPKIERMSHLKGVYLDSKQKHQLISGSAVRLDNMTSKAGTTFSALVRVSAASRGLRFDPVSGGQSRRTSAADGTEGHTNTTAANHNASRSTRQQINKPAA